MTRPAVSSCSLNHTARESGRFGVSAKMPPAGGRDREGRGGDAFKDFTLKRACDLFAGNLMLQPLEMQSLSLAGATHPKPKRESREAGE